MSALWTKIKAWWNELKKYDVDYMKSLEAKIDELEVVLKSWRDRAIDLEKELTAKIEAEVKKLS